MRVILADDAVVVREGLARLLAEQGVDVIGQAGSADELMRLVAADPPDVAVVDIRMPPTYTNEGLRRRAGDPRAYPEVGTVVLSQYVDVEYALKLVTGTLGAGRLPAQGPDRRRRRVRRRAAAGRRRRNRRRASLVDELVAAPTARDPLAELTPREREVLVADRRRARPTAASRDELFVTRKTVEAHVRSILAKLDLPADASENRRVHAVLTFLRAGGSRDPGGVKSGVLIDAPDGHRP